MNEVSQLKKIRVRYGKKFLDLADWQGQELHLQGIYESALPPPAADETAEVARALDAPVGSERLEELARHVKHAVVIASDHTRPVPSRIIMPQILERLRRFNPQLKITILVATGCHRLTTREELIAKFGEKIVAEEEIKVHVSTDESSLADLGTLPSGGKLRINRLALECDLLVAEGFIEPHFFAGFSGGRKSVLPGIVSRTTVLANHCSEFISSPYARTGNLEHNPIHEDMVSAAKQAKLRFIVNVVINGDKKIVKAFAGDTFAAHAEGTEFLRTLAEIRVPESDIVITGNGGYPLDQNVYQSVKGMTAGEAACRPGGVIIMCAACNDGHGGESFYRHLAEATPEEVLGKVSQIPRDRTEPDQWEYQILARILHQFTVIMVTEDCPHEMLREMGLRTASTLSEALEKALKKCGSEATVAVIPDGVSAIVRKTR